MEINIQLFGNAAAKLGAREINIESQQKEISVEQLLNQVQEQYPALESMRKTLAVAVNMAYVGSDHIVCEGDEVAIIPPVSGG